VYWSLPTVNGDSEHQVTISLVRLLRRLGGGVMWHNTLVDPVLRGALLIDWTLSGRLVENDTAIELDTTPSGNPAADALLARIAEFPERPLAEWLLDKHPTEAQLVDFLVANGVLVHTYRRLGQDHYLDSRASELLPLWTRLCGVLEGSSQEEPPVVALAVLAQLLGVLSSQASDAGDDVVAEAGELTGLLTVIRDFGAEQLTHMALIRLYSTTPTST
jgi:Golgi phosphoprotein 3 GPP34